MHKSIEDFAIRGLLDSLDYYVGRHLVKVVTHPENPDVVIYNYTPKCTYSREWNSLTRACRGLILNKTTGEILARPFDKFFNYGEPDAVIPEGKPEVTVKLDGSLGISYYLNGELRWATRGSFTSPQARAAQRIWKQRYGHIQVPGDITLLVEIIHPTSKVIVDYDFEDLVLIGARDRLSGYDFSYGELSDLGARLGLRVVERVDFNDLTGIVDYVKKLDAQNEGFVLRWPDGYRLKVKSPQYLEVFRVAYGLTIHAKARAWAKDKLDELIMSIPEELRGEIEQLKEELDERLAGELEWFHSFMSRAPKDVSRKEYALWVKKHVPARYVPLAFGAYDENLKKFLPGLREKIAEEFIQEVVEGK